MTAKRPTSRPWRWARWPRFERSPAARRSLVAVDDVQWLDAPTAAVLAFAARRLGAGRSVSCSRYGPPAASRLRSVSSGPSAGPPGRVALAPLSLGAVQRLLQLRLGWIPSRPALHHVHDLSGGNPFFALELGRALQAGSLHVEPGERLPVTLDALVTHGSRSRPRRAPRAHRGRVDGQPTVALVDAVAGDDALAEAERAQIVAVRDGVVRFDHPLLASGAYAATDPATRRELHAALAARVNDPEERAGTSHKRRPVPTSRWPARSRTPPAEPSRAAHRRQQPTCSSGRCA